MSHVYINAEIYTGEETIPNGYIRFDDKILEVGPMSTFKENTGDETSDLHGKKVIPGFIDVHSHGGYGVDTMDADPEKLLEMIEKMRTEEGITSYFPTTMTQSPKNIEEALQSIRIAAKKTPIIQGVHLEGPFISPVFKGAQPEQYIQKPDAETMKKWNELSGGLIKLVTYAPEETDSTEFETYCEENGIRLSIGHTNATREELLHSHAKHVTHLYNAQRGLHHREPGVAGHALLEEDITAEMIVDGFHIAPDMVKLAYKLKGSKRIELITDAMRAKGMPEGESELGGQKVYVKNKQARLEAGNLAGSVLTFPDAFRNIQSFTGCTISEAVQMSSVNQAKEFGLANKGKLEVGYDADFLCLNTQLELEKTVSLGRMTQPAS